MIRRRETAVIFGVMVVLAGSCLAGGYEGITMPSQDVALAFTRPGRVSKVLVKPGDIAEPNQLLIQLDDEAERAQLEYLKAQADDETNISAAKAQLELAKSDLKRVQDIPAASSTQQELEHARLTRDVKRLSLDYARFQKDQDILKHAEAEVRVRQMRLHSRIKGIVEMVVVEPGESVQAFTDVVRVVSNDLLWIDVNVPLGDWAGLRPERTARVEFLEAGKASMNGKVLHVATVATVGFLSVRVEVINSGARPAGEKVIITFPPPPAKPSASKPNRISVSDETKPRKKE